MDILGCKNKKKIYFGTNTKMFKTPSEAEAHISLLRQLTENISREELELFVIPSYTSLHLAVPAAGEDIIIGAQNMGWEERGQYTGEISPLMLQELGVKLVMIGHSERRHVLHETDYEEEKKVRCAVEHGFRTLLCIGETLEQKEYCISREVLAMQLKIALRHISAEDACRHLWVAYEPVWAIGVNGIPADENYANEMHGEIKACLAEIFNEETANQIPVLYGGSVNKENAINLIKQPDIDGLFIGRSAWDAENFNSIIRMAMEAKREITK